MANSFQGLAQSKYTVASLVPQVFAATAAGTAVDIRPIGTNRVSATLAIGAVVASGNVTVKMQASPTTVDGDFVDITGAVFTAATTSNQAAQVIDFTIPSVATTSASPNIYVRAYGTLNSGTSVAISCVVEGFLDFATSGGGFTNTLPTIN